MDFEKALLKFIHDANEIKSPYCTTISDLSVWFGKEDSEVLETLEKFKTQKYCTSSYLVKSGKITIKPLRKSGIEFLGL